MSRGAGFRPLLSPPQGRLLQRSYRPLLTCFTVSGCIAVLIFVIFGLTAFNIYHHRFGVNEHKLHAGDDVSLREASLDLSPTFCSAYRVNPQGQADFYLLPHKAELERSKRVNTTFKMTAQPGHAVFLNHIRYLTKDSAVSLSACRGVPSEVSRPALEMPTEFLVIVGDANYEEWQKHFNNRHVRHRVLIQANATCTGATSLPHLELTVTHPANYFFILVVQHHEPDLYRGAGDVTLMGKISKTKYNISGAVSVCSANETSCQFPLSWGSHVDVVAQVRRDPHGANAPASFLTDCRERVEFWVPIFGVVPIVIMSLMSLWCWFLLVKKRSLRSHYRQLESSQVSSTSYGSTSEESTPFIADAPPTVEPQDEEGCASIQD